MDEQKLRQLFRNRANCYADADDVIQAMDEDCFIETVNEALRIHDVVGRSEQFYCDERDNYGNTGCTQQCMACVRDEQAQQ